VVFLLKDEADKVKDYQGWVEREKVDDWEGWDEQQVDV
jgi:hypothetical protein